MSKAWLFTVEVTGFPRDDDSDPVEVHGGHRERWVVMAEDRDGAEAIIGGKVYDRCRSACSLQKRRRSSASWPTCLIA
jgi:hypothetical protein